MLHQSNTEHRILAELFKLNIDQTINTFLMWNSKYTGSLLCDFWLKYIKLIVLTLLKWCLLIILLLTLFGLFLDLPISKSNWKHEFHELNLRTLLKKRIFVRLTPHILVLFYLPCIPCLFIVFFLKGRTCIKYSNLKNNIFLFILKWLWIK